MSNKNDEIRKYPLTEIKRIRKKDAKIKMILKIIFKIICYVLVFSIGFASGLYYKDSDKFSSGSATKTASSDASDASINSAASNASNPIDPAAEAQMLENFKQQIVEKLSAISPDLVFSFGIKNLRSGQMITFSDQKMNCTDVINLFIMETVFKEASAGSYELTPEKEDALFKMITDSHNESSSMFIDDFGGVDETGKVPENNTINMTIKHSGYERTELNRKMYDQAPAEGSAAYENYTSAKDVIKLLEGIYNKTLFDEPYNTKALELLKGQVKREKIPAKIDVTYPDVTVACKTGELSQVESDVALIMCEDFDLAFAIFINDIPNGENQEYNTELHTKIREVIADISLELVKTYKENSF